MFPQNSRQGISTYLHLGIIVNISKGPSSISYTRVLKTECYINWCHIVQHEYYLYWPGSRHLNIQYIFNSCLNLYIYGLELDCGNCIANTSNLPQSGTQPLISAVMIEKSHMSQEIALSYASQRSWPHWAVGSRASVHTVTLTHSYD